MAELTVQMLIVVTTLLVGVGFGAVIGVLIYRAGQQSVTDDRALDPGETTGRLDIVEPEANPESPWTPPADVDRTPVGEVSRPKHALPEGFPPPVAVAPVLPAWPDADAEDTQQIQAVRVDA